MNNVNKTGYTKGSSTENNSYNIIPSSNITMKNTSKNLLAVKLDKDGNPIGFEFMEKGKEYDFENTKSVLEIPKYQAGTFNVPPVDASLLGFTHPPNLATQSLNRPEQTAVSLPPQQGITPVGVDPAQQLQQIAQNAVDTLGQANNQEQQDTVDLRQRNQIQFFNPYAGVDIPTSAVTLGQSITNKDTLGTVASGAKLGLGLARNIVGGMGIQNRNNQTRQGYSRGQKEGMITPRFLQQGGALTEQDILNIRKSESEVQTFDDSLINSLFEKTPAQQAPQPYADVNLGKYGEVGYFDIIDQSNDSIKLRNTQKNPHNRESINQLMDQIQKLNPNRKVELDFFQTGGQQDIIDSLDLESILSQVTSAPQPVQQDNFDLGKYNGLNYFDVVDRGDNRITLSNTPDNPQNANSISQQIRFLRQQNPKKKIDFKYKPKFQDGGSIDDILNDFNEEQLINSLLQNQQEPQPAGQLNLDKYKDLGYFNTQQTKDGYNISNTSKNPQNAQGFKDQLKKLQKANPDIKINSNYLPSFKKGGEVTEEQLLTGEFITGLPEDKENLANAEVEAGEYIKTIEGDVAEVEGKKHSEGGEKIIMQEGDKVLTDYTELGKIKAKQVSEKFDLKIKPKDTFSTVLDKFKKKIGLNKLVDEEEGLIKQIEAEQSKDENQTRNLNIDFLSGKLNKIAKDKEPIEEARKVLFDSLYEMQEASKPKEKNQDIFREGGEKDPPKDQVITGVNEFANPEDFVNQSNRQGIYFGKAEAKRLDALERNFPLLVQNTFNVKRDDLGNIISADIKEGESIENFQRAVDNNYQALINDAERLGDPSRVKAFVEQVTAERFNTQVARGFDNKFGNFTSSRKNFGFRSVTPEDLKKLKDSGITTYKQLVDKDGNIKPDVNLSPESKTLLEKFKGSESNFILGDKDIVAAPEKPTPEEQEVIDKIEKAPTDNRDVLTAALLSDQYPMLPSASQPHLKNTRRYDSITPETIDPNPFLEKIFQQQSTANRQLEGLPPGVAASAQANLTANTQKAVADTMLKIEQANLGARQQANIQNANIQSRTENARASDALNYERRQFMSDAVAEQNLNNYFNKVQDTTVRNFREINNLNLDNALFDDIQATSAGTFQVSEAPDFKNQLAVLRARQGIK